MSGEGASYQAETLMQPVPSETGTKENRNTGSAVMTMEPERGAKDQTEGEAKKKAHRTGQPKQSVEQVEQEIADVREEIAELLESGPIDKPTFGSETLGKVLKEFNKSEIIDSITLVGLCTDICVISNAMLLKAFLPEVPIMVDSLCCAGVTPESHERALEAMKACQIEVL